MREFMSKIVDNVIEFVEDVWNHVKDATEFVATILGILFVLPFIPFIMLVLFVRELFIGRRVKDESTKKE